MLKTGGIMSKSMKENNVCLQCNVYLKQTRDDMSVLDLFFSYSTTEWMSSLFCFLDKIQYHVICFRLILLHISFLFFCFPCSHSLLYGPSPLPNFRPTPHHILPNFPRPLHTSSSSSSSFSLGSGLLFLSQSL